MAYYYTQKIFLGTNQGDLASNLNLSTIMKDAHLIDYHPQKKIESAEQNLKLQNESADTLKELSVNGDTNEDDDYLMSQQSEESEEEVSVSKGSPYVKKFKVSIFLQDIKLSMRQVVNSFMDVLHGATKITDKAIPIENWKKRLSSN